MRIKAISSHFCAGVVKESKDLALLKLEEQICTKTTSKERKGVDREDAIYLLKGLTN